MDNNFNNDNNASYSYRKTSNKFKQTRRRSLSDNRSPYGTTAEERLDIYIAQLEIVNFYFSYLRQLINYAKAERTRKLAYDLKPGEIYEVDFGIGVGSELRGRHYAVVMCYSHPSNQIVEVIPLKTKHKQPNPTSDVLIGNIPGLEGGVSTIAVFNQKCGIDKMRIYRKSLIRKNEATDEYASFEPVAVISEEQLNKIRAAIKETAIDGKTSYSG